jgi:predicted transposase YbfD/YdcC
MAPPVTEKPSAKRDHTHAKRKAREARRTATTIENRLFWVKDVTLREDHSRIRSGKVAFVMSVIRNATINCIRSSGNECIAAAFRSNVLRIPALLTRLGILIQ